jgi:hypothetical protein
LEFKSLINLEMGWRDDIQPNVTLQIDTQDNDIHHYAIQHCDIQQDKMQQNDTKHDDTPHKDRVWLC